MVAFATRQQSPTTVHGGDATISTIHSDILKIHILTRLDGPALASAACVSSELHSLISTDQLLWQRICKSTWPSVHDPRVGDVISSFPSSYRSFFFDSYPFLSHHLEATDMKARRLDTVRTRSCNLRTPLQQSLEKYPTETQFNTSQTIKKYRCFLANDHDRPSNPPMTTRLISAVDIYYKHKPILSKVLETETVSNWFMSSPFRIELINKPKSHVSQVSTYQNDTAIKTLEDITMSWILIDPTRKRAMNVSSEKPVLVERNWITGDIDLKFATVIHDDTAVECGLVVTFGTNIDTPQETDKVSVSELYSTVSFAEAYLCLESVEGGNLNGKDSLVILQEGMEFGKRESRGLNWKERKERFEGFLDRKRLLKEKKQRSERVVNMVYMVIGVIVFFWFLFSVLFR